MLHKNHCKPQMALHMQVILRVTILIMQIEISANLA